MDDSIVSTAVVWGTIAWTSTLGSRETPSKEDWNHTVYQLICKTEEVSESRRLLLRFVLGAHLKSAYTLIHRRKGIKNPLSAVHSSCSNDKILLLWNLVFRHCYHKSLPMDHVLSQSIPVHVLKIFITCVTSTLRSPTWSLLMNFWNFYSFPHISHPFLCNHHEYCPSSHFIY